MSDTKMFILHICPLCPHVKLLGTWVNISDEDINKIAESLKEKGLFVKQEFEICPECLETIKN